MRETIAAFLLIAYGLVIGLLLSPALGSTNLEWTRWAAGARDLTTALGLLVGGAWAYSRYTEKREREPRTKVNHMLESIELDSGQLLLRVVLEIENNGHVAVEPHSGSMLVQVPPSQLTSSSLDPDKSWIKLHEIEYPFRGDDITIEPGETERYSRDVVVAADVRIVQLHSRIACYKSKDTPAWDDTTIHVLKPKPATASV